MKVYMVDFDVENYQQLSYDDPSVDVMFFSFNGSSLADKWEAPAKVFIPNPMKEKGDFREMGEIVLLEKARRRLAPILDPISEYYEFRFEGERHTLFNVTFFCDCLDKENSLIDWRTVDDKKKFITDIRKHVFREDLLPQHSVFRLPGPVVSTDLYTIEGCFEDKNKEFKYVVEKNNLKGLKFKLVWDSEAER